MEFKQIVYPLLRWWWLIVLAVVLSAGSSYLVVSRQPDSFQATTTLAVGQIINNPNPNAAQISLSQQLAATYVDLAQRETVRNAAMEALDLNRLPAYRVALAAQNRLLIEITVTDTDAVRASAVANTLADVLIEQSPTGPLQQEQAERRDFVNERLDSIQQQIGETESELNVKQEQFVSTVSALELQALRQDITALESKLTQLESNYASLLASVDDTNTANTIEVLIPATPSFRPAGPGSQLTIVLASLIGAILATAAAFLLSYLDDTIKTPDDIERFSKLPTLAGIAQIKRGEDTLVSLNNPRSPTSEAFRGLRTAAQFASVDSDETSFLITSANPNEGKSTVAANLAVALAQAGFKTLLVDADLRRPRQHEIFGLPNTHGITNLLLDLKSSRSDLDSMLDSLLGDYMQSIGDVEELRILTSGPLPPNPSELLGSAKMKDLLQALNQRFDFILFDSAPTLAVTDSIVLANRVSGVIVVVEAGRTRQPHLKQVVADLKKVNGNVLGVVLNRISPKNTDYYYYYRYRNSYYDEVSIPPIGARTNGNNDNKKWFSGTKKPTTKRNPRPG